MGLGPFHGEKRYLTLYGRFAFLICDSSQQKFFFLRRHFPNVLCGGRGRTTVNAGKYFTNHLEEIISLLHPLKYLTHIQLKFDCHSDMLCSEQCCRAASLSCGSGALKLNI
jgi:hypothetical protein